MKINPINTFKNTNFNGNLSPNMKEIFANPDIPKTHKKTLWELSEIPYFCEAAQDTSQGDLLRISKLVKKPQSNVLELILKNAVFLQSGNEKRSLLSLKDIAKNSKHKNLLDIIRDLPVKEIDEKIKSEYETDNAFSRNLLYTANDADIKLTKLSDDEFTNLLNSIVATTSNAQNENNIQIFFTERLKSNYELHPQYYSTPKKLLDPPIQDTLPNIQFIYNLGIATKEDKQSLFRLEEIPYFNNLVKDTPPVTLNAIARLNHLHDRIFEKMFSKKTAFEILDPQTAKITRIPIIDTERLLADKKYGIILEDNVLDILANNTLAINVLRWYEKFKEQCENKPIERMVFKNNNEDIDVICYTKNGTDIDTWYGTFTSQNPEQPAIKNFLEKVPLKTAVINFSDNLDF